MLYGTTGELLIVREHWYYNFVVTQEPNKSYMPHQLLTPISVILLNVIVIYNPTLIIKQFVFLVKIPLKSIKI